MKRSQLKRKTTLARGTSQLNRTQPLTTAPLTPGKRPKAMPKRRKTQRRWVDLKSRRAAWVGRKCAYGEHGITSCGNMATEPEHFIGKGWQGADDERCIVPICRACHTWIGRTREAKVNGLWIKLREISRRAAMIGCDIDGRPFPGVIESEMADLRHFIENETGSGFRFARLLNWIKDGSILFTAQTRVDEILDAVGITEE